MASFDESLAKNVYRQLKSDIICGRIKDGYFFTLNELEKRFSISKTPIRDALSALEIEGYLQTLPRKGYLVCPVTQSQIRECFQMRLILETAAVELAVKAADDYELKGIFNLVQRFPEPAEEDCVASFNEWNNTFHMAVIAAAHNSILSSTFSSILENLSRILLADSRNLDFSNERDEHKEIARALLDRDAARAIQITRSHILQLLDRVYSTQHEL